ncbi:hypothetical protein FVE85_0669 [Porphyridium purpureum]|uniref:Uncharacterized protein n=1 Tax=Porphyridium purpureum TaxID=35688 RepID=A0A5J4Z0Z8_PORPP|nr:hypothetical protein FVE85_0669 [Porphyridium purpureum]|eukprot:POR2215..scf208_2
MAFCGALNPVGLAPAPSFAGHRESSVVALPCARDVKGRRTRAAQRHVGAKGARAVVMAVEGDGEAVKSRKRKDSSRVRSVLVALLGLVGMFVPPLGAVRAPLSVNASTVSTSSRTLTRSEAQRMKSARKIVTIVAKGGASTAPRAAPTATDLPTQTANISEPKTLTEKLLAFAKKVGPGVFVFMAVFWLLRVGFEKFKQSQIDKLRSQLGAMGGFDAEQMEKLFSTAMMGGSDASAADSKAMQEMAAKLLEGMSGTADPNLASKMRLNLKGNAAAAQEEVKVDIKSVLLPAASEFEAALINLMDEYPEDDDAIKKSVLEVAGTQDVAAVKSLFTAFGSKQLSALIDKVAAKVESDDRDSLVNLSALATCATRLNFIGASVFGVKTVQYTPRRARTDGADEEEKNSASETKSKEKDQTAEKAANTESVSAPAQETPTAQAAGETSSDANATAKQGDEDVENTTETLSYEVPNVEFVYTGSAVVGREQESALYKRYSMYCFSSEERMQNDLISLTTVRSLLGIDEEAADRIDQEVAAAMLQVAMSGAAAFGEGGEDLDSIQKQFASLLGDDKAQGIKDETALMNVFYSLQQVIDKEGLSTEDISELRKMATTLGIDLNLILNGNENMIKAMGPEAEQIFKTLRKAIADDEKAKAEPGSKQQK